MSTTSLAFKCDDFDDDEHLAPIEKLTVDCWSCDEDNPFAVPPDKCPVCKGSGRAPVVFTSILKEIHGSHAELNKSSSADDALYLDY